jgi:hypothetical protein
VGGTVRVVVVQVVLVVMAATIDHGVVAATDRFQELIVVVVAVKLEPLEAALLLCTNTYCSPLNPNASRLSHTHIHILHTASQHNNTILLTPTSKDREGRRPLLHQCGRYPLVSCHH